MIVRLIDTKHLFSVNVGDSSALLITKNKMQKLTYEHRASDPKEMDRIKYLFISVSYFSRKAGGSIISQRLEGVLMITRALGDVALKSKAKVFDSNMISRLRVLYLSLMSLMYI